MITACGDSTPPGGVDAAREDGGSSCECDDGLFCNGVERCADGSCEDGEPPCTAAQTCDEAADRCVSTVCDPGEADADEDGVDSMECGGNDCDDSNASRFPGNAEVCDAADVDEDCDATTYGDLDADDDGYVSSACCNAEGCGEDCDDAQANVHPTATEDCNLRDDDCDGAIDEGAQVMLWLDADGDGFGDPTMPRMACADTVGLVNNDDDCDDDEILVNPGTPEVCDGLDNDCDGVEDDGATEVSWYVDADGDGFGSATSDPVRSCTAVAGHAPRGGDCNDSVREINPGAAERCNGRDDDCDGSADFRISAGNFEDDDGDGAPDIACPGGAGTDCDDENAAIGPDVPDHCGDAIDNDCDDTVDEASGMSTWYLDADGDGWGDSSSTPITSCMPQAGRSFRGGDCDDDDAAIHPGQIDGCDGLDVDCDGERDEDGIRYAYFTDADGDGYGAGSAMFSCTAPDGTSQSSGDCADDDATRHPGASEDCNVRDDDCDSRVDEGAALQTFYQDTDRDGHGVVGGMTRMACVAPVGFAESTDDCDDGDPTSYPGATELCNNRDDDCDGAPDDQPDANAGCAVSNGTGLCSAGFCEIATCTAPFDDCNLTPADGCETDTRSSPEHCGGCANRCGVAASCTGSVCETGVTAVYGGGSRITSYGHGFCARRASGHLACWGHVADYALSWPNVTAFTDVSDVAPGAQSFALGATGGCGVRTDGGVTCWGFNVNGEFGNGSTDPSGSPEYMLGTFAVSDAVQIARSNSTTCVLRSTGRVACAGAGSMGELGNGGTTRSASPVLVTGMTSATFLDGNGHMFCAVQASRVFCWGTNPQGLSLAGGSATSSTTPREVPGITNAIAVSVTEDSSCALHASGGVSCWGRWGGFAGGPVTGEPTTLAGFSGPVAELHISVGRLCGRLTSGYIECYGANPGDGTTSRLPPGTAARVSYVAGATSLALSESGTSCAVATGGAVWCWGEPPLGNGSTSTALLPVLVSDL